MNVGNFYSFKTTHVRLLLLAHPLHCRALTLSAEVRQTPLLRYMSHVYR